MGSGERGSREQRSEQVAEGEVEGLGEAGQCSQAQGVEVAFADFAELFHGYAGGLTELPKALESSGLHECS